MFCRDWLWKQIHVVEVVLIQRSARLAFLWTQIKKRFKLCESNKLYLRRPARRWHEFNMILFFALLRYRVVCVWHISLYPPSLTDSLRQGTNTVVSQLAWNAALHVSKELRIQDGERVTDLTGLRQNFGLFCLAERNNTPWFILMKTHICRKGCWFNIHLNRQVLGVQWLTL